MFCCAYGNLSKAHTAVCVFRDRPVCQCVIIFFSARHHSLSIMGIMHSLVCLPQAQVKQPRANNEHSVAVKPEGQGNIS